MAELDLTDILCALLSPTQAYGYCFAYTGGTQKYLRGHFFFYETDLEAVAGAMEQYNQKGATSHVFAVLCVHMTLKQKELARQQGELDTKLLTALLTWFIEQSGHKGYSGLCVPAEYPKPTILRKPNTKHNTDNKRDADKEIFVGSTFQTQKTLFIHQMTSLLWT